MDQIEEFVYGCGCGEVTDIDSTTGGVIGCRESGGKGCSRVVARRRNAERGSARGVETLFIVEVSVFGRIRKKQ